VNRKKKGGEKGVTINYSTYPCRSLGEEEEEEEEEEEASSGQILCVAISFHLHWDGGKKTTKIKEKQRPILRSQRPSICF
jgi:hypothetical protein